MRRLILIACLGLGGMLLLTYDVARAQTCFTLQAELMHLQARGGGNEGDRDRYERAFREQARVMARTEARAREAGCFGGGFFFFRRAPERICNTLIPKLREMQGNLARLDRLRRRAAGGNRNGRRIRELEAMLDARGCDDPGRDVNSDARRAARNQPDTGQSRYGTYRTLCVRTCDGYYFPISFSTTSERFADDEHACQAMCPAAESKLFVHRNPGGTPENMTALDGEAYMSLPTAFQYRKSINPSCSCGTPDRQSITAALAPAVSPAEEIAPRPRSRPAPGEDPETLSNRLGDFVPRASSADAIASTSAVTTVDGRPIRVVGPAYWETGEDGVLLTPVPN